MNRQTTVTLLVVLIVFCFSMATAQDELQLRIKQHEDHIKLYKSFVMKVEVLFTPEEKKELLGNFGGTREQWIQKVVDILKKKTPEQRKKFMQEFDLYESQTDPAVRKTHQQEFDTFRKEMEKMNSGSSINTLGSIAIVAALTVF